MILCRSLSTQIVPFIITYFVFLFGSRDPECRLLDIFDEKKHPLSVSSSLIFFRCFILFRFCLLAETRILIFLSNPQRTVLEGKPFRSHQINFLKIQWLRWDSNQRPSCYLPSVLYQQCYLAYRAVCEWIPIYIAHIIYMISCKLSVSPGRNQYMCRFQIRNIFKATSCHEFDVGSKVRKGLCDHSQTRD